MSTVTKKDLIDRIAAASRCKRSDVKTVVQAFLDEMVIELGKGNRLEFRDFGVFEVKDRAARVAQNPKTLQRVAVPPKRTVKFKVGRLLKVRLDENYCQHPGTGDEGVTPEIVVHPNPLQPGVTSNGRATQAKSNDD